jgi:hypothetical protein
MEVRTSGARDVVLCVISLAVFGLGGGEALRTEGSEICKKDPAARPLKKSTDSVYDARFGAEILGPKQDQAIFCPLCCESDRVKQLTLSPMDKAGQLKRKSFAQACFAFPVWRQERKGVLSLT